MAEPESNNDGLWHHYWTTWKSMFAIQSIALVLGLSIVIPTLAFTTGRAFMDSGKAVLSDTDLLGFVVGPNFPLLAVALIFLWLVIHVFGYAVQLIVARAAFHGNPTSVHAGIHRTCASIIPLVLLATRFLAHLLALSLPFLLVIFGVLAIQIRDYGLQHYLTERPPEFILALAFALATFAVMTFVLVRAAASWVLALPLVLFDGKSPAEARRISRRKSRHIRGRAFFTFALWSIGTPLLVLILNAGWPSLALWASEKLGHRLGLITLVLSVLILVSLVIAVVVGFICLTLLSLQQVRLFRLAGLDTDEPPTNPKPITTPAVRHALVGSLVIIGLFTIGLSYRGLDGLRIADHAEIAAHRGASSVAPENTTAAILRAFDLGANAIIVDIQARADGKLMAFADPDFSRIAGRPLRFRDATADDLAAIDVGSWFHPRYDEERVPSLDQVIGLCRDRAVLILQLPPIEEPSDLDALAATVVDQIENSDMAGRIHILSRSQQTLNAIRALRPQAVIGYRSDTLVNQPLGLQVNFLIVPAKTLGSELIAKMHRAEIEVFAADTTDPARMSAVLSRGADGLLLDDPGIGRKVLEERADLNPGERLLIDLIVRFRDILPSSTSSRSSSK